MLKPVNSPLLVCMTNGSMVWIATVTGYGSASGSALACGTTAGAIPSRATKHATATSAWYRIPANASLLTTVDALSLRTIPGAGYPGVLVTS